MQSFSLQKKWGPQRKDFGGGYGFPGFYRAFVSTTGLESFSLQPEKFPKRFSFGGGRVRFFLLCYRLALVEWVCENDRSRCRKKIRYQPFELDSTQDETNPCTVGQPLIRQWKHWKRFCVT